MVKKIAFTVLIVTFVSCTTTDSDLITKNSSKSHVLLDLDYNVYHHKNKNIWTFIRLENERLNIGYR